MLFDAIREQLDRIIGRCGFESVPDAFKFKVKNRVRLGGLPHVVGYIVNTTKRCVHINIKFGRNMGTVHPYVGEVTGELRGNWVDSC